jgi:glutamine cyclotransferase
MLLDFSTLYPKSERRKDNADVLNGISKSATSDLIYVTGKNWDRMFLVRYVKAVCAV